jgi:hypothetical protein
MLMGLTLVVMAVLMFGFLVKFHDRPRAAFTALAIVTIIGFLAMKGAHILDCKFPHLSSHKPVCSARNGPFSYALSQLLLILLGNKQSALLVFLPHPHGHGSFDLAYIL